MMLHIPRGPWPPIEMEKALRTRLHSVRCPACGFRILARSPKAVDAGALEHYYYVQHLRVNQQPHGTRRA